MSEEFVYVISDEIEDEANGGIISISTEYLTSKNIFISLCKMKQEELKEESNPSTFNKNLIKMDIDFLTFCRLRHLYSEWYSLKIYIKD